MLCGYNKCLSALVFHHKDPSTKEFNLSKFARNNKITYELLRELEKCIMICANCHAEVHEGMHKEEIENLEEIDFMGILGDLD